VRSGRRLTVLGNQSPVSGCYIRIDVPVYCSDPMPFAEAFEDDARPQPAGSRNPPMRSGG